MQRLRTRAPVTRELTPSARSHCHRHAVGRVRPPSIRDFKILSFVFGRLVVDLGMRRDIIHCHSGPWRVERTGPSAKEGEDPLDRLELASPGPCPCLWACDSQRRRLSRSWRGRVSLWLQTSVGPRACENWASPPGQPTSNLGPLCCVILFNFCRRDSKDRG